MERPVPQPTRSKARRFPAEYIRSAKVFERKCRRADNCALYGIPDDPPESSTEQMSACRQMHFVKQRQVKTSAKRNVGMPTIDVGDFVTKRMCSRIPKSKKAKRGPAPQVGKPATAGKLHCATRQLRRSAVEDKASGRFVRDDRFYLLLNYWNGTPAGLIAGISSSGTKSVEVGHLPFSMLEGSW